MGKREELIKTAIELIDSTLKIAKNELGHRRNWNRMRARLIPAKIKLEKVLKDY